MQGCCLKLFVPHNAKHDGKLLYEWMLEEAHRMGISGGSAFRAIAGYGRHGRLHEEHFFELADDVPVAVEFVTGEAEARQLLAKLATESISVFYLLQPAEFGTT